MAYNRRSTVAVQVTLTNANQNYNLQALVQAILDYRGAKLAVDLFDQEGGVAKLHENPGLLSALAMMQRAQDGVELWGGDLEAEGKAVVSERAN